MKIYLVWDNDDYGSTFSPDIDYIVAGYKLESQAMTHVGVLNKKKRKYQTRAYFTMLEIQ